MQAPSLHSAAPPVPSALAPAATWDALRAAFRWHVPARFNIAAACCDAWADIAPERPALIHFDPDDAGETFSVLGYATLRARSEALAADLTRRGVRPGDRVAILLPQGHDTAVAHMAIYRLGAVAVPLALLFGAEALAYRLETSGAKAILTSGAALEKVAEAHAPALEHVYCADGPAGGAIDLPAVLAGAERFPPRDTAADDPALMIFTSGTTGPPKGALHAHRVLIGHVPGVMTHHMPLPLDGDVFWTPADWAWAGGLLNVLLPGLMMGVPVVSGRAGKFDPELAFETMSATRATRVFMPPTAIRLCGGVERPRERFDLALRTLGSGGEQLGGPAREWVREALGIAVNEFYGQTECNLVLSGCAALGVEDARAIGRPVPGHSVAVIDEAGVPLPAGEIGQIAIRRPDPVMFLEYWNRPDATAAKFRGDWLLTGDRGLVDEAGLFRFEGRDDDVITSAGFRIGPGEIEDCLAGHPDVALAAAVGKPDPVRTEIVKAYVVPREGAVPDEALAASLRDHVKGRLSAHEYPREIAFVTELPLTTTGKVIRRELRERAARESESGR